MSNTNLPRIPKPLAPAPLGHRRRLLIAVALIAFALAGGRAITRLFVDASRSSAATR
jgi:hypothetical protein